jgi:hypothetical protein
MIPPEKLYVLVIIIEQRRDPPEEAILQTDKALIRGAAELKSRDGDYA